MPHNSDEAYRPRKQFNNASGEVSNYRGGRGGERGTRGRGRGGRGGSRGANWEVAGPARHEDIGSDEELVELTPKQAEFLDEQKQFVKKHNIGLPVSNSSKSCAKLTKF